MSNNEINELRLEQYSRLIGANIGSGCELHLVQKETPFNIFPVQQSISHQLKIVQCCQMTTDRWIAVHKDIELFTATNCQSLIRTPLTLGAEETRYWLTLLFPGQLETLSTKRKNILFQVFVEIKDILLDDYTQNLTLNGLAYELAARYEELNVIYKLEDINHLEDHSAVNKSSTLNKLIDNCLDYLSVDLAAIISPEENIQIYKTSATANSLEPKILLEQFSDTVFTKVKSSQETLVINNDIVTDWSKRDVNIPYKYIVSPIFSLLNDVSGILVLANNLDRQHFTNSDRKLCDVLAIEVSNIFKSKRDSLTGLINRGGLREILETLIKSDDYLNTPHVFTHLNIDNFKMINDACGQAAGDRLLLQISSLLSRQVDQSAMLFRVGADEFCILHKNQSLTSAEYLVTEFQRSMHEIQFIHDEKSYDINLSIGIVDLSKNITDVAEILTCAQVACRAARETGGDKVRIYKDNDNDFTNKHGILNGIDLVNDALKNDSFLLYGQAIVATNVENIASHHYEVLLRMQGPEGQVIPPSMFIPAAERYDLMTKVDKWVVDNALHLLSNTQSPTSGPDVTLSINVSGKSVCDDRFVDYVVACIQDSNIRPAQLCFEITETAAVANLTQALRFISRLRELGCTFALDDFGSGMSSFGYLKHLPVDYLKIDGCFVKNMLEQKVDAAMVESINNIGHVMGLLTIAEFVENKKIADSLSLMGVDFLQGYGLHHPEPLSSILQSQEDDGAIAVAMA